MSKLHVGGNKPPVHRVIETRCTHIDIFRQVNNKARPELLLGEGQNLKKLQ